MGQHTDFTCTEAGLHLSKDHPFVGASPDGLVSCSCCGDGLLEIKCPFNYCGKELPPTELDGEAACEEDLKRFCLKRDDGGHLYLPESHAYFYQIQAQLNICDRDYCDFVVWSESGVIMLRFQKQPDFFNECMVNVNKFIKYGVLPELVGKWLTKKVHTTGDGSMWKPDDTRIDNVEEEDVDDPHKLYCYCAMPVSDTMLVCHNKKCTLQKFHMECLRVRCPPRGKWYCPHCRLLPQFNRSKKGKENSTPAN